MLYSSFLNFVSSGTKENPAYLGKSIVESFIANLNMPLIKVEIFGQEIWKWVTLFALILIGVLLRKFFSSAFVKIEYFSGKTENRIDDLIIESVKEQVGWTFTFIFWYVVILQTGFTKEFIISSLGVQSLRIIFLHLQNKSYN